ncbi:MAG TPA: hypothetical protein VH251_06880, partial [Verrucomicrobiae bacterium]|nr:hypothetical protein [Verrucomicrobiae bacterium]
MKAAAALLLLSICGSLAADVIDLSGKWSFQMDPDDQGIVSNFWQKPFTDTITLPGTISQAEKGNPLVPPPMPAFVSSENLSPGHGLTFGREQSVRDNTGFAHLYERYSYIGPAWYRRSIEVPQSWSGRDVELELERAMWQTRVWVNGVSIGSCDSLTTPHRYEIGSALQPGHNEIVIRVDNRRQLAIGDPHAYTEQAQGIWNGIVGSIALTVRDRIRIDGLQLRPDLERSGVEVTVQTHNGSGRVAALALSLQAAPDGFAGQPSHLLKTTVSLAPGDGAQTIFYPTEKNFER